MEYGEMSGHEFMGSLQEFLQNHNATDLQMGRDGSMGKWMCEMGMDDSQVDDVGAEPGLDKFGG